MIGAGAAGLSCALSVSGLRVHVLTKGTLDSGANSLWAQGGIAAAVSDNDSAESHAEDTIVSGAGLTDPEVADFLTHQARQAVEFLCEVGAKFDLDSKGEFALSREAAHKVPRVLHANRDATGLELMRALSEAAQRAPNITVMEHAEARRIVTSGDGEVLGVWALVDGDPLFVRAPRVVLATGGAGQLFRYTTNPPGAVGAGLFLAARAGAVLTDLEFVQFHPTALLSSADPLPLVTEAVRGAGATLINELGERFMVPIHPGAELAPRDVVARGVWSQIAAGHRALLDAREAVGEAFATKFPTVFALCQEAGIDPVREPIPVVPAAHYHMGGVAVDLEGRSNVPGLWACGEVSSTGLHGANRLASNSLLEAVVFGLRVGDDVSRADVNPSAEVPARPLPHTPESPDLIQEMRNQMNDDVGLVRCAEGLTRAEARFASLAMDTELGPRTRNRAWMCWAIAAAALRRRESRGSHYRTDFPTRSEAYRLHSRAIWEPDAAAWRVEFNQDRTGSPVTL